MLKKTAFYATIILRLDGKKIKGGAEMFKRLQWKMVIMFIALVFITMLIAGVFMMSNIIEVYRDEFISQQTAVAEGDFAISLKNAFNSKGTTEEKIAKARNSISLYAGEMGLGVERECYVLDAKSGEIVTSYTGESVVLEKTPNIISAMAGEEGNDFSFSAGYMDYAHLFSAGDNDYIIYVKDNRNSVNSLINNMLSIIIKALLISALASVFLCFFFAKTITRPITVLTEKAEDFAEGNFDSRLDVTSQDEIGTLMETFNYMGGVMGNALSEVAGEKHKVEVILENVGSGVVAFNTDQEIIHINESAKNMFGALLNENTRFDEFWRALDTDFSMEEFLYLNKFKTEERDIALDQSRLKAYVVPFKIENDKVAGVVAVFEDITRQFNLEESRRKFVAEVSHELKTPLTTIGTYTETLLDGYLDDKEMAKSLLSTVHNETVKMTSLVKNLLTLSRYDAQKEEIQKEIFSLDELVRDVVNTFKVEAEKKGLSIEYNLTTKSPSVLCDRFQIERVVKNVVSNAIKYTDNGKIKVFCGFLYNEAYIKIEDTGRGIPEKDLPHIFERFYRVDKARSRENGGTGLGLSIAKEIIESHGGTITAESALGEGTRFTIKIPIAQAEEE